MKAQTKAPDVEPTASPPSIESDRRSVPEADLRLHYEVTVCSKDGIVLGHRSTFDLHGALHGHLREHGVQNLEAFLDRGVVKVVVSELRAFMNGLTREER